MRYDWSAWWRAPLPNSLGTEVPAKKLGRNQMLYRNIKALQWQDRRVWFLRKLFLQHKMSLNYFSFEGKLPSNSIIQEDKLFVASLITHMFFCEELIPSYIAAWEGCSKNADRSILWYSKFEVHFCVINAVLRTWVWTSYQWRSISLRCGRTGQISPRYALH